MELNSFSSYKDLSMGKFHILYVRDFLISTGRIDEFNNFEKIKKVSSKHPGEKL